MPFSGTSVRYIKLSCFSIFLCSMVTIATKLFVIVKWSSHKVSSVKLGSSTSNNDLCRESRRISSSQNFLLSMSSTVLFFLFPFLLYILAISKASAWLFVISIWPTTNNDSEIKFLAHKVREPGSSISIVSGYRLDDRAIEVRFPAEAKDFSSNLCVQTGSGAHAASCTLGTGVPFPGTKARPGCDADHSAPSSAEVENEKELFLFPPPPQASSWRVVGQI
jgi:hypothetical protein